MCSPQLFFPTVPHSQAQGLRAPITTFQKLRSANQILYVLKDTNCNRYTKSCGISTHHMLCYHSAFCGCSSAVERGPLSES